MSTKDYLPEKREELSEEMIWETIRNKFPVSNTDNSGVCIDHAAKSIWAIISPVIAKNKELSSALTKLGDNLIWTDSELKKAKEENKELRETYKKQDIEIFDMSDIITDLKKQLEDRDKQIAGFLNNDRG